MEEDLSSSTVYRLLFTVYRFSFSFIQFFIIMDPYESNPIFHVCCRMRHDVQSVFSQKLDWQGRS